MTTIAQDRQFTEALIAEYTIEARERGMKIDTTGIYGTEIVVVRADNGVEVNSFANPRQFADWMDNGATLESSYYENDERNWYEED